MIVVERKTARWVSKCIPLFALPSTPFVLVCLCASLCVIVVDLGVVLESPLANVGQFGSGSSL